MGFLWIRRAGIRLLQESPGIGTDFRVFWEFRPIFPHPETRHCLVQNLRGIHRQAVYLLQRPQRLIGQATPLGQHQQLAGQLLITERRASGQTVIKGQGAADAARDVRGFAMKNYTEEETGIS